MLKLTQGTAGTGSSLLSAEQQLDFHAVTFVLQQRAINMLIETKEFLKRAENRVLLHAY